LYATDLITPDTATGILNNKPQHNVIKIGLFMTTKLTVPEVIGQKLAISTPKVLDKSIFNMPEFLVSTK